MRHLLRCYWISIVLIVTASCKTSAPPSELQHNANQPTRGAQAWQWIAISEAEYYATVIPTLKLPPSNMFLSEAKGGDYAELPKRMQFWLTGIHHMLKTKFPELLKNTPTPKAIIVRDGDANAFVSPTPVCIDIPVRFNPSKPVTKETTIERVSFSTDGEFTDDDPDSTNKPICVRRALSDAMLADMVKWFNAMADGCTVTFSAHPRQFTVSDRCPLDAEIEDVTIAKSLVVTTTSNWITINTGLFTQMKDSEEQMLTVVLHELGHYYRSHMTVFPREYNYFYHIPTKPVPHKPAADPSLKDEGQKIYESAKMDQIKTIEGQKFPSSLYNPILQLVHRFCRRNDESCNRIVSCKTLDQKFTDGSLGTAMGDFPDDEVPNAGQNEYHNFEQLAENCMANIKMSNHRSRGFLSISDVGVILKRNDLKTLITPNLKPHLLGTVNDLKTQIIRIQDNLKNTLQNAEERRMARYTVEIEADEFSAEQYVRLGFDPHAWIDAYFTFFNDPNEETKLPVSYSGYYRGDVDNNTCQQIEQAGWKFKDRPFIPDRGGFYDPHPTACFRNYDIAQEIEAHRYTKAAYNPPKPPGSNWHKLADMASSLNPPPTEASAQASTGRMTRIIRKRFVGCPLLKKRHSH